MDAAPRIDTLVLDAAPLLSLSPLRGLARNFVTTPQVIAELKDQRAREHFERLGLTEGVNVQVRNPDASSVAAGMRKIAYFIMNDCFAPSYELFCSQYCRKEVGRLLCALPDRSAAFIISV